MLMKIIFLTAILMVSSITGYAAERPYWSFVLKGGLFYPEIEDWEAYYGRRNTGQYAVSLAYKFFRALEAGLEGGYIRDKGRGLAPRHSAEAGGPVYAGSVTYELFPIHVFALGRLIFSESQWLVPYAGAGWTRIYYREEIEYQNIVRGYADGYITKAGIQLLLDEIDPAAANSLYLDYGVEHTYLFFEVQKITAKVDNTPYDLGGLSLLLGLLFEF